MSSMQIYDNDLAFALQKSGALSTGGSPTVTSWSNIPIVSEKDKNRNPQTQGVSSWGDIPQDKSTSNNNRSGNIKSTADNRQLEENVEAEYKESLSMNSLDDRQIQKKMDREKNRRKEQEVVNNIVSPRAPTLSTQFLENIDLDTLLQNLNNDNQFKPPSPRQAWSDQNRPESLLGAGDRRKQNEAGGGLTLIQKLAALSMEQCGEDLTDIDPSTGAKRKQTKNTRPPTTTDNRDNRELVEEDVDEESSVVSKGNNSNIPVGMLNNMEAALSGGSNDLTNLMSGTPPQKSPQPKLAVKKSTASCGTNTSDFQPKILTARLPPIPPPIKDESKSAAKDKEPTVFIDLRNFDQIRQEQQQSIERVQKVLGINPQERSSDSSDSEDDIDDWQQQRQRFKHQPVSRPVSVTTRKNTSPVPTPPRVINMADLPPRNRQRNVQMPESELTPAQREEQQRQREHEQELERRQEIIRKLREKVESERQAKLRLQKRLDALRPSASVNGRHDPAETTPTVFDLEASYEPAPRSLPPVLSHQDTECVLLTIHLSSNGEIILHRGSGNKSVDTGSGLSATYTTLLTWLLALVPGSFSYLQGEVPPTNQSPWIPAFNVIGLQQVLLDEQLCLEVAVTPVEQFDAKYVASKNKKSKKVDQKGCSAFQQHLSKYLSTNTLHSVCPWLDNMVSMEVGPAQDGQGDSEKPGYVYKPPLPNITTKPLSTFIQVNPDPQAVAKVFNTSVGFFWQTVESDESMLDQNLNNQSVSFDTQNTIALTYKKIYQEPSAMMGIFNRVLQLGLDLSGVRLVYPTPEQMNIPKPEDNASTLSELELLNNVGAVLAICIRGTAARTLWIDAVGPSDPQLARRTDPNSLCALYGGESRDECLLFCPRTPARVQTELARWFGGRVPPGNVIDVGTPYTKKDALSSGSPKGRRTKKVTFSVKPDNDLGSSATTSSRPLATLTATVRSEIFLVLSPLVPPKCFGIVMASCQRRGYQITGIKRCRLSAKKAACLGIPSESMKAFCVGSQPDTALEGLVGHIEHQQHAESSSPSTILQLQRENASHSAASLVEDCMVQLTLQGIMGTIQEYVGYPIESRHMFHAARFSDTLLSNLGGEFSRCHDPEVQINPSYIVPELYTNPEVEQITVLLLLGHERLKSSGLFVGKLVHLMPYSKNPQPLPFSDGLEILGLKWLPGLVNSQAKEVTPYEVGDRMWKTSLHELATEPCLVIALRGVNAYKKLESVLPRQPSPQKSGQHTRLDILHSRTAEEAYTFLRLFFTERELFSDPMSRPLLPYIPSCLHPHDHVSAGHKKGGPLFGREDSVFDIMLSGPQLLTTLMLIKPRALSRHLPKMLKKITQEGFKIVALKILELTEEQAVRFVPSGVQNEERQKHLTYLTSGPSLCLSLQRENAVKKLLDLLGPDDPQSARRQSQFYWRGVFGVDPVLNAAYASMTYKQSVEDQSLFFPDGLCCEANDVTMYEQICCPAVDSELDIKFSIVRDVVAQPLQSTGTSTGDCEDPHSLLQQTTCIVLTPLLMRKFGSHTGYVEVIEGLVSQGFDFVGGRMIWFTQEQAEHFLHLIDAGSFKQVPMLMSGCSIVLALQRDNAVLAFNTLLRETFSTEMNQGRSTIDSLLDKYGAMILRPSEIKQAHNLLGFFFDQLIRSSHIQVLPKLG